MSQSKKNKARKKIVTKINWFKPYLKSNELERRKKGFSSSK